MSLLDIDPEDVAPALEPEAFFYVQGCDGPKLRISALAAEQSELLKGLISNLGYTADDSLDKEPIPLENVTGDTLEKVVEWCEHHRGEPRPVEDDSVPKHVEIPEWDEQFLAVGNMELFDLILASNYLDIQQLMNYTCKMVANMAKGKSPEEMRRIFAIPSDEQDEAEAKKLEEAANRVAAERGGVLSQL